MNHRIGSMTVVNIARAGAGTNVFTFTTRFLLTGLTVNSGANTQIITIDLNTAGATLLGANSATNNRISLGSTLGSTNVVIEHLDIEIRTISLTVTAASTVNVMCFGYNLE